MKAIIGVDADGLYKGALDLLGRLGFPEMEVELMHTSEPLPPYPDASFAANPEVDLILESTGEKLLDEAAEYAKTCNLKPNRHEYAVGPVTACLMEAAESEGADLIAIGSHEKSPLSAFFLGSVGRGLTISAPQSVLISKGACGHEGPITAVFATDYSEYAQDALRHLIARKPAGLTKIVLVTAVTGDSQHEPTVLAIVESGEAEKQYDVEASKKMVAELAAAGIQAEASILGGHLHDCIEYAVKAASADLLIIGAHEHGFIDRLVSGSASLKEVLETHHPILVLRR